MIEDTEIKLVSSKHTGTPILKPNNTTWGSLVNLLKVVLSEGFNVKPFSNLNYEADKKTLNVHLDIGHGYEVNQVVSLLSEDKKMLEGEYRVLKSSPLSIILKSTVDLGVVDFEGVSGELRVAPLGYTILKDSIDLDGTLVLKNGSSKSPSVLKVVDFKPPGFTNTWTKFATVCISNSLENLDSNLKAPFSSSFPNIESTGNSVAGAEGIHGWAKWYYSTAWGYNTSENKVDTSPDIKEWKIIGDNKTFYLFVKVMGYYGFSLYSFGNFKSLREQDSLNSVLHASFRYKKASETTTSYTYGTLDSNFTKSGSSDCCCLLSSSLEQEERYSVFSTHIGLDLDPSSKLERAYPSQEINFKGYSESSGKIISSPIYLKDSFGDFRGQLRGIEQTYGTSSVGFMSEDRLIDGGSSIILTAEGSYNGNGYKENTKIPYIFRFYNWEEA